MREFADQINACMDVLARQTQYCRELLALSKEKKDAIIRNEVSELQKITSLENILISKNQKLEGMRLGMWKELAASLHIEEGDLTFSHLREVLAGQSDYDPFLNAIQELKQVLEELKIRNRHNSDLIRESLDYIEFTMNAIRTGAVSEPSLYSRSGEEMSGGQGFFDARQ